NSCYFYTVYPPAPLPTVKVLELLTNSEKISQLELHLVFPNVQVLKIWKHSTFNHRSIVVPFLRHCPNLKKIYVNSVLIHDVEEGDNRSGTNGPSSLNYVSLLDQS